VARIRTIKPEFFTNEKMADLSPAHRLLFIGLWTEADREGRLKDRPRALRVRLLPFDDITDDEFDAMLDDLHNGGFLVRYESAGIECIAIPKFEKHQRPHPKELPVGLPTPPEKTEKRQSRFFPRPIINDAPAIPESHPSIPSRPTGKEILESGKESLENGDRQNPPPLKNPRPGGETFWSWFQEKRAEIGLVRQKLPHPADLGKFYSEAMGELNGDEDRLKEAVYRFAENKKWQESDPPLPWGAFAKLWRDYAPQRKPNAA
jgi:hypothetical protein